MADAWTPEKILDLRTRLKMTQYEFALAVGVASPSIVSLWESGKHSPGRMAQIRLSLLAGQTASPSP